ncbi:LytR C-terminal domain-containing protein [Crossiella sp. SN42]|nr:LytR C-terminal domain-containing protein [Crossiella sp. SN42]
MSTYESSQLPDLPAVSNNLTSLAEVLTDPEVGGFAPGHCAIVHDPGEVRDVHRVLREHADRAEDTFLVYFAGHGLLGTTRHELHLALAETDHSDLRISALGFDLVRELFLSSRATNRVLILDCCYSGRAVYEFMTTASDVVLGQIEITGTYTLTSAPANGLALAPLGATYTVFTGALLDLLTRGLTDGPPLLALGDIYRHLRRLMTAQGYPLPQRLGSGTTDLLALARNRAFAPPATLEGFSRYPHLPKPTHTAPVQTSLAEIEPAFHRFTQSLPHKRLGREIAVLLILITVSIGGFLIAQGLPPVSITGSPQAASSSTTTTSSNLSTASSTIPTTTTRTTIVKSPPAAADIELIRSVQVNVYNNSNIKNLNQQAADYLKDDGWTVENGGNYSAGIIPTSTVYYRTGTTEDAAAKLLARRFKIRAEPRFDGLKEAKPGLILIVTRDFPSPS